MLYSPPLVPLSKRTHQIERMARVYDDEIGPIWGDRFGRMLLRDLVVPERGQVLDVACGTGTPTVELLRRMGDGSRIIAIDGASAMLDVARRKIEGLGPLGKRGVFFRTESALPRLSFASDVYDVVVCNLGLAEMPDTAAALRDFARVTKLGGQLRCTLPLAGTFAEFHDVYREVLIKHDLGEALARLDAHLASYPDAARAQAWLADAGLEPHVDVEEWTLLFKSSREFFFAPVIEFGPLPGWKAIAGTGQELQDVFWYVKEAIDAYFAGRPFAVTVRAGCLAGRKVTQVAAPSHVAPPPELIAVGTVAGADADGVEEISNVTPLPEEPDVAEVAEVALDAFTDGKPRPPHL